jgi:hypothetical protein
MSTAEREMVLNEHRNKAEEGDPDHLRIKPAMDAAIQKQKFGDNIKKQKQMKNWNKIMKSSNDFGFNSKKATYFWDYNTIEATLLACAVFVCLSGVMFESGRFDDRPDLVWMYDLIGALVAIVLIYSLIYYLAVFTSEVLGHSPQWLEKCCANKKTGHLRDNDVNNNNLENLEYEMADISNALQNNNTSKADQLRLQNLEKQMIEMNNINQTLVDLNRKNKTKLMDNPLHNKNVRGRGKKNKKKKKQFGGKTTTAHDDEISAEINDIMNNSDKVSANPLMTKRPTFKKHKTGDGKIFFESIDNPGQTSWEKPINAIILNESTTAAPKKKQRRLSSRELMAQANNQTSNELHVLSTKRDSRFKQHTTPEGKLYFESIDIPGKVLWNLPEDGVVVLK